MFNKNLFITIEDTDGYIFAIPVNSILELERHTRSNTTIVCYNNYTYHDSASNGPRVSKITTKETVQSLTERINNVQM